MNQERKHTPPTLSSVPPRVRSGALSYLSLCTSLGTLLCCALPSLLVLFGLGATVASVLSEAPWLVTLSHHKAWVFIVAGALICSNFVYVYAVAPKLQMRGGLRPDRPHRVPDGKSFQPGCALVLGSGVRGGLLHRIHPRADPCLPRFVVAGHKDRLLF
jgi:hypothetical protein